MRKTHQVPVFLSPVLALGQHNQEIGRNGQIPVSGPQLNAGLIIPVEVTAAGGKQRVLLCQIKQLFLIRLGITGIIDLHSGKARLCRINGVEVDFTGEYSSIVVVQKDAPGVVAYITKCLSELGINIAFMRLFRESKGNTAYTIVESDDLVPEDIADTIRRNKNVYNVMVVQM